jgi:hypothetical protein
LESFLFGAVRFLSDALRVICLTQSMKITPMGVQMYNLQLEASACIEPGRQS